LVITSRNKRPKFKAYSSTQLRFALTFVVITGLVLLFLNVYCCKLSQRLFYESKQRAMSERAQLIAGEIGKLDVVTPAGIADVMRSINQLSDTQLLVTDKDGTILYNNSLAKTNTQDIPIIAEALEGNRVFSWRYRDGIMYSEIAVPIVSYNVFSGCVYILETDTEMGQLLGLLLNSILTVTLLLEIGLLIFAVFYAYQFSRRLRKIMASMDIIQEGNYDHKVRLGGHDELTILGEEFNDLTERLQISENKRRQFVSDASHELKTPLSSIKLLSDSILQYDMDQETIREFVSDIGNEADRLNRTTAKLLSLTRLDAQAEENCEIIHMAPTVERAIRMLSGIAQTNHIQLDARIQKDLPVLITEDDLYEITFNLLENGIKYNAPGGTLTVRLFEQDENAVLQVTDTGVGIPEDALRHIFERFYRVDKARSRANGGSGLGLSIVKNIVEKNRGNITVESTVGHGSVFTVTFPIFDMEADAT
jgi:signal transduction histidine kinase